jgi:hypothetical protein
VREEIAIVPEGRKLVVREPRDETERSWAHATGLTRDSRFTKPNFGSFAAILPPKVRDRYADESDALERGEDRPDQAEDDLTQLIPGFNARFQRSAAGRYLKVRPFDFHRHCSTARIRFLAPNPDLVGHRNHARFDPGRIGEVFREGRF